MEIHNCGNLIENRYLSLETQNVKVSREEDLQDLILELVQNLGNYVGYIVLLFKPDFVLLTSVSSTVIDCSPLESLGSLARPNPFLCFPSLCSLLHLIVTHYQYVLSAVIPRV